MKKILYVLGGAIAVLLLLVAISVGQREVEQETALAVDSRLYKACGLDRLSETERSNLYSTLGGSVSRSYLQESAVRYLEKDHWTEVEIRGTVELQLGIDQSPRPYLLAYGNGRYFLLETSITQREFPMPGLYFGKESGSRLQILEKRGEIVDYWIKEETD